MDIVDYTTSVKSMSSLTKRADFDSAVSELNKLMKDYKVRIYDDASGIDVTQKSLFVKEFNATIREIFDIYYSDSDVGPNLLNSICRKRNDSVISGGHPPTKISDDSIKFLAKGAAIFYIENIKDAYQHHKS